MWILLLLLTLTISLSFEAKEAVSTTEPNRVDVWYVVIGVYDMAYAIHTHVNRRAHHRQTENHLHHLKIYFRDAIVAHINNVFLIVHWQNLIMIFHIKFRKCLSENMIRMMVVLYAEASKIHRERE